MEADDLGEAIRDLRGSRSQKQVARRAGICPAAWSLYESGRRRPREETLAKIVRSLGCTRLDFETRVWQFRRRRLLREERPRTQYALPAARLSPTDEGILRARVRALFAALGAEDESLALLIVGIGGKP